MEGSSLYQTYSRANLEFVRGEGVWLETSDGRRFLDCAAGIAVNSLGHSHPGLVKALKDQADKLWHVSNVYAIEGQEAFARKLAQATFADRVFCTNSGAEALECAIKTARRYFYAKGEPERIDIITFEGAFHGRTLATIAAGGQEKYLEGFGPKAPGFIQVPFGDHEALLAAIGDTTAGLLIEPIQGEGGIRPVPTEYLRELRRLCDDKGILLILDEVQTGVGRTGKLFAHEWAGITPDIMAVAKGIGGGFPLGACLATEEAASGMKPGTHGTTYGGNPLAMAVGNAVLDVVLADGFLDSVQKKGLLLKQKLAAVVDGHPAIFEEIRGKGLMLGLKCRVTNTELLSHFREAGVLAVGAGDNVLRIMPPLTITEAEIEEAVSRIDQAATAMEAGLERGAAE
ncbi:aspartate aminotransferase family protein [Stappia indica]|uniref:Acetylornithine aminotransferase n=1 Tax=Stappia indica TaxID=538381 RepID=A0A285SR28_9HYPH|nr:aspartate aminotransferase family protein [Stappia indica]MCC4243969.1 aspartate aminotransferase family protein [Stappia indica]SOC10148.1 acetylornithine aminotransferase apoenzyme [Stappia indica]